MFSKQNVEVVPSLNYGPLLTIPRTAMSFIFEASKTFTR